MKLHSSWWGARAVAAPAACILLAAVLSACGGGGGAATPEPPVPPPPTLQASLSRSDLVPWNPEPLTLTWSTTDATHCHNLALTDTDFAQAQMGPSGTRSWAMADIPNSFGFGPGLGIRCFGPGGSVLQYLPLTRPDPFFPATSAAALRSRYNVLQRTPLPTPQDIRGLVPQPGEGRFSTAVGIADFVQQGWPVAITATLSHDGVHPADNPGQLPDAPARLHFVQLEEDGTWKDITDSLLPAGHRRICINPRGAEVADLNADKVPDVVIYCTGRPYALGGVMDELSEQYIILSHGDGTYRTGTLPVGRIYGAQMTVVDVGADELTGRAGTDILGVDPVGMKRPFALFNNGDGTFRLDTTVFPEETVGKAITGIREVRLDGGSETAVLLSGATPGSGAAAETTFGTWLLQWRNGRFEKSMDFTDTIPTMPGSSLRWGAVVDVVTTGNIGDASSVLWTWRLSSTGTRLGLLRTHVATGTTQLLAELPVAPGMPLPVHTVQGSFISANCGQAAREQASHPFHTLCTYVFDLRDPALQPWP